MKIKIISSPWGAFHTQVTATGTGYVAASPVAGLPVACSLSGLTGYSGIYPAEAITAYRVDAAFRGELSAPLIVFSGHGSAPQYIREINLVDALRHRNSWLMFRRGDGMLPRLATELCREIRLAIRLATLAAGPWRTGWEVAWSIGQAGGDARLVPNGDHDSVVVVGDECFVPDGRGNGDFVVWSQGDPDLDSGIRAACWPECHEKI